MTNLVDKPIIVTGGASGIGAAITTGLLSTGYTVAVFDLNAEGAQEVIDSVGEPSGRGLVYQVDLTDHSAVASAVAELEDDAGTVYGLVNNAGWDETKPFTTTDYDFWQKVININLYTALNASHAALTSMIKGERGGRLVCVGSDAGRVGSTGEAVYSACKGGQIALMKTLARENARYGITCNTVCPGPTMTPLTIKILEEGGAKLVESMKRGIPMRRLGEPDDFPALIAFFMSEESGFVTGQTISVSGGLTMHG